MGDPPAIIDIPEYATIRWSIILFMVHIIVPEILQFWHNSSVWEFLYTSGYMKILDGFNEILEEKVMWNL